MGSGGAREGAGRPGWRGKCERRPRLDVRELRRAGYFRQGYVVRGSWRWTRDGEPIGDIRLELAGEWVRLIYTWAAPGDPPVHWDYFVKIGRTPCPYGGKRPWFICPQCEARRAVLYGGGPDGYFGCRGCLQLGYASETATRFDRLWQKERKLEKRLGPEGSRPRRMHRRTYERISARLVEATLAREDECDRRLAAYAWQLGPLPPGARPL